MAAFEIHPAINAALNATTFVLLTAGWRAIRRGDRDRHRAMMLAALTVSGVFLVSYLIRVASSGTIIVRSGGGPSGGAVSDGDDDV